VECYDSQCPERRSTSQVSITVTCGTNPPRFQTSTYFKTIFETWALGTPILEVTATDVDNDRVTYSITGDAYGQNHARINEFYLMGAASGNIYLKKSLLEGTQETDNVRH